MIELFTSRQSPDLRIGSVRTDPRAAGASAGTIAGAGQLVSDGAARMVGQMNAVRRADLVSKSVGQLSRDVEAIQVSFEADTGYEDLPQRFEAEAAKAGDLVLNGIEDAEARRSVQERLDARVASASFALQRRAWRLESADIIARLDQDTTDYARMAAGADDDASRATNIADAMAAIDTAEATSAISAVEAGNRRRGFRAQLAINEVSELIAGNPKEAVAALKAGGYSDDLDPDVVTRLTTQAQGAVDRNRREARATLGVEVREAVALLGAGLEPAGLDGLQSRLAAGGGDVVDLTETLTTAVQDSAAIAAFVREPMVNQAAQIAELQGKGSFTARDVQLLGGMTRANAAARQQIAADPLAYAGTLDLFEPAELDPTDAGSWGLRAQQARQASAQFGIAVSPMRPGEVDALARRFEGATPDDVTGLLAAISQGLDDDQAETVAGQLVGERPAMALALASVKASPRIASKIIAGERLIQANPDVRPSKVNRIDAVKSVYGEVFDAVPGALETYIAAAEAIYAANRVPGGNLDYNSRGFKDALKLAAGGRLNAKGEQDGGPVSLNGRKIIPPLAGMSAGEVKDSITGLTVADLVEFGNGMPVFGDRRPLTPDMFRGFRAKAQLVTIGPGRYRVLFEGVGFVATVGGDLYELDLRRAIAGERRSPATEVASP